LSSTLASGSIFLPSSPSPSSSCAGCSSSSPSSFSSLYFLIINSGVPFNGFE
jgi:hypothetical protein